MKRTGAVTIVGYALWLASTSQVGHAFSVRSLQERHNGQFRGNTLVMASYRGPPGGMGGGPMGGGGGGMGGGPMGGGGGMGPGPMGGGGGMGPGPMGGGMGGGGGQQPGYGSRRPGPPQPPQRSDGRSPNLDRDAMDYVDELRDKRSGARPDRPGPRDGGRSRSYSANSPPTSFSVPNAGNTAAQPRARGVAPDARGLAQLASGVTTPMDKYNFEGPGPRERGKIFIICSSLSILL